MNADYEGVIRRAVGRLPATDAAGRARLYDRARGLMDETALLGDGERQAARDALEAAIGRIEADAGAAAPRPSQPPLRARGLSARGMLGLGLAACLLAVAGWWMFTPAPVSNGLLVSDFAEDDGAFAPAGRRSFADSKRAGFEFDTVAGKSVLRISGRAQVIATGRYAVDTARLYRMEVALRNVEAPGVVASRVFAGVATFDAEGRLQNEPPGTHRYFALSDTLAAADGWQVRAGYITGEGNESHLTFRPGTKTVAPVIVVNVNEPKAVVEIDYVRFEECIARDNCRAAAPLPRKAAQPAGEGRARE